MKRWLVALVVVLLLFAALLLVRQQLDVERSAVKTIVDTAVAKEETAVDLTTIVTELGKLSRLETASMRVVNVSQIKQSYGIIPDMLAGDHLTLMAVGEVFAGVDLSKITQDDVYLDEDGVITIVLPAAEVLVSRLDNEETKVINRDTGVLRSPDTGLEGRARAYAEQQVRQESVAKGILDLAQANAEEQLAEFVTKLGATSVRFVRPETRDPESSERRD
jgi:hypothetical protein